MQLYLLCLLSLLSLAGCVYYGDIHGNSKPYTATSLSTPTHITTTTQSFVKTNDWWTQFHDPELNTLISTALASSPSMQLAENRAREAQHIAERAGATLWPSADLNGYAQRQRFSESGLVPPPFNGKIFNIGDLGFNFNYDFDFWGKHRQTLAAKIGEKYAAEADLAQSKLIISSAVASTYFQLLSDMAQYKIAQNNLHQNQQILDIVSYRLRHGIVSDIPLKSALADVESARISTEQYKQNELIRRNQLAALIGKNPLATQIETKPFIYINHQVKIPSNLTANVLANRPDIASTKLRAEAAAHEINVAKARFFPDISLSALLSYQSIEFHNLFNTGNQNNAITGAIDLPIFDAGARRANLGVKYAEYDLAVNEYNAAILTGLRETADQQTLLSSLSKLIKTQEREQQAVLHNYKLINMRYNHGIVDYVEVLQDKKKLLQQESLLTSLQTQYIQAEIGLIKALGGIKF